MPCHLPKIGSLPTSIGSVSWTIDYDEADRKVLADLSWLPPMRPLLECEHLNSFRRQVHIATVPFLMAVDYEVKRISFLSPRAHLESFLLKRIDPSRLSHEEKILYEPIVERTERVLAMDVGRFPSSVETLTLTEGLSDLRGPRWAALDGKASDLKRALMEEVNSYRRGLFEFCSDYGLTMTARYDLIRIHLLKFVATLSSLDFDVRGREVSRLFSESLRRFDEDGKKLESGWRKRRGRRGANPFPLSLSLPVRLLRWICSLCPSPLLSRLLRYGVRKTAKRFIAGKDIESARVELEKLSASGRDATLDQLGELVVSSEEADRYKDEILKLIESCGQWTVKGEKNAAGISRAHVSIKVSALCHDFNPHAFDYTYGQIYPRLREILKSANERDVFINIDAEQYRYRDAVFAVYRKTLLHKDFEHYGQTGIVVQAYLRDASEHLREVIRLAERRRLTMPIRLVKGAYWDAETVEARAHSYNPPQFINKEETDVHYRQLMIEILNNAPHVQLCVGGHNIDDHCYSEVLREKYFPHSPPIEHQCLHMTYEALSVGMVRRGFVVRNYVPVGPLLVGMSYLVRRIMENSSQVGVLVQMRFAPGDKKAEGQRWQNPWDSLERRRLEKRLDGDAGAEEPGDDFFNTPPVRLYIEEERKAFEKTLDRVQKNFAAKPLNIDECSGEEVSEAISRSKRAFERGPWPTLPRAHRASYLLGAAHELLVNRLELAALICFEAGKSSEEALGDVDEAVDFLNFYARVEQGDRWSPRGPVAVIGPWNFPLAIPCGMTAAALVAGNTVLLKSAEQTPLIVERLVRIFKQVGLPDDVLIHLPGRGETVGASLVESPHIAQVAFTGSAAVGLDIARKCAGRIYCNEKMGRSYPMKVVTEMGGKNAIVVTANADLDEAVFGVLYSAYAHAGQKCSACSRVLVDERVAPKFLERFSRASQDASVGMGHHLETRINPLISSEEKQRLLDGEEAILKEVRDFGGRVHVNRLMGEFPGHCVGPLVVELPASRALSSDSFFQRELFAPVVHVATYQNLQEAIGLFNVTPYALTGGVYAQSQDDIDFLARGMECGNLYINRPNTGARVGIEPFGGFKLSGTGPKAGHCDYVKAFMVESPEKADGEFFSAFASVSLKEVGGSDLTRARQVSVDLGARGPLLARAVGQGGVTTSTQRGLCHWLAVELEGFIRRQSPNLFIPGQLSYNDFHLPKENVVLLAQNPKASPHAFLSLIAALAAGSGVNIVSDSGDCLSPWAAVADRLLGAGLPRESLRLDRPSSERLKLFLGDEKISACIFDGELETFERWTPFLYPAGSRPRHLRRIYHPWDAPPLDDYSAYVLQFIEIRSFAVNTMRYGAPLELDF